jgi:pyruvate dehydrogenase E1 component alpha subunit
MNYRENVFVEEAPSEYRILDEAGNLVGDEDTELSAERLVELYRWMVFLRVFDENCLRMQRQGRLGTYAPSAGQEAAQIGSASALEPQDWVIPSYRDHAALIMRGLPPEYILIYWNGSEEGSRIPQGVNVFPVSIPISTQLCHAVGYGWAAKIKGDDVATIAYFGDGGTSEGDFHEAANFAAVFEAPTVFFCSNNQYAISYPRVKQTRSKTIAQKAIAYGMPGVQVDGNDLLAVYKVTREAVRRAHEGKGPTLIEAVTYRFGPHTTADDPKRYRNEEEVAEWKKKDPLLRMRSYLTARGMWSDGLEEEWGNEVIYRVKQAVEKYERMPKRDYPEIFKYVYAEMTPSLERQMKELAGSLERKKE